MESENLLNYIQEIGFRTLEETQKKFSEENKEIFDAMIDFLVSKNKIRKINYRSPSGTAVLLYIVSNE